jgi:hypothetical protein
MKLRYASVVAGLVASGAIGLVQTARAAEPTQTVKPAISPEASAALEKMGKALSSKEFSFKAQTIRVYQDEDGQPLHIFHMMKVDARRPDRLAVHVTGDDGSTELLYDGKTVAVVGADERKYASIAAPNTIEGTLDEVSDRLGTDFPLADFLAPTPAKAFLTGVTTGKELKPVTIDGVSCRHFFFTQSPGMELELWLENTEQALPRRLIVTYRLLPGQPNFIAEFSDWNLNAHLADAAFTFQPAAGSTKIELEPAGAGRNK